MFENLIISNAKRNVWVYNIGADKSWIPEKVGIHKIINSQERRIINLQAELMIFLTSKSDLIYLSKLPEKEFIRDMELFGMEQPEVRLLPQEIPCHFTRYISESEDIKDELGKLQSSNQDVAYIPYVVTEEDEKICMDSGLVLWGGKASVTKKVNSKVFARRIAQELGFPTTEGFICSSEEELAKGYAELLKRGYKYCVIKEPYGTSGKGVHLVKNEKTFKNLLRMIRFPEEHGTFQVLLEGWIEDKKDINYQIAINSLGNVKLLSINEQLIKQTTNKGTRFPAEISPEQETIFKNAAEKIGRRLFQEGYTGIMGIDSIIKPSGEVIPILELNGRFNQSTFYIPLFSRLLQWKRQALIKYYDIRTTEYLNYRKLKDVLVAQDKAFSPENKTGILILNSACLSYDFDKSDKKYLSRVYVAVIAEQGKNINDEAAAADRLIGQIP